MMHEFQSFDQWAPHPGIKDIEEQLYPLKIRTRWSKAAAYRDCNSAIFAFYGSSPFWEHAEKRGF